MPEDSHGRRIFKLARPYLPTLALATVFLLLSSGISLSIPWLIRKPIDLILTEREIPSFATFLGLILLFIIQALFSFAHNYLSDSVGEHLLADLRVKLFSHLQTLSLPFFTGRRTGELLSRMTNDLGVVQTMATEMPVNFIRQTLVLIGGVIIIFYMNWRLTLLALLLIPLVVLVARFIGRRLRALSTTVQDQLALTTTLMEEMISGIRTIKSFGREGYERKRFAKQTDHTLQVVLKRLKISTAFGPLMLFLGLSTVCGLLWFGAKEVQLGKITAGEVITFIIYAVMITGPVGNFARLFSRLQEGLGASRRIFELLDTEPEVADLPDARPLPEIEGTVRFEQVSFHYLKDQGVLHDLDFTIRAGEKVALVGPSGAGKSTLVHLLHRFYDPTSGRILIDGHPLKSVRMKSYYDQIAYVPQEVVLFAGTLRENMLYGKLDATEEELIAASRLAHADDFIMNFPDGYETRVGEKGLTLSGGQRQRIAIARAFLKQPSILIFDEATAFLDNESELKVQDALEKLMSQKTTFMIAHRLSTIRKADRILVFNKGKLAEQGKHEQLIEMRGLYYHLYTLKEAGAD